MACRICEMWEVKVPGGSAAIRAPRSSEERATALHNKLRRAFLILAHVAYTTLSTLAFKAFQRGPVDERGDTLFYYDTEVVWNDKEHWKSMVLAIGVVAVITVGMPLYLRFKTRSLRRKNLLREPSTRRAYGALYDAYKPVKILQNTISDRAALHCTATARSLIHAECSAVP